MIKTTKAQRGALLRLLQRTNFKESYRQFRKRAQATIGCGGAIVVRWCDMWIVIESDGYTHS